MDEIGGLLGGWRMGAGRAGSGAEAVLAFLTEFAVEMFFWVVAGGGTFPEPPMGTGMGLGAKGGVPIIGIANCCNG